MAPPMTTTPATILSFFIILSLKNFAFSRGEVGGPSDIELCEGANPSDAKISCEASDASDADAGGVDIDSSECPETGSIDDNDDGWCEGVNLDGGVSVIA